MDDALHSLQVWTRSRQLAVEIYKIFHNCKDYGFKDQITRAAVSVPSNIAEGYERNSKKDFSNFLRIARGSCAELRTQLYIGQDIGFIEEKSANRLQKEALELSKMLQGLINRYKTTEIT
ncbi:MAG: four helix bundle protein [Planctomycetota bacterium]|jgi:four helix bundle protein